MKSAEEILLSIIVPVSRMSGRLENLKSWIAMVNSHKVEIILVHDVQDLQTDGELEEIVAAFPDKNIRLERGYWGYPGGPRNLGIEKCRAEWIIFWDSDDIGYVEQVLPEIELAESETNFIVGQFDMIDYLTKTNCGTVSNTTSISSLFFNPGLWRIAIRRKAILGIFFGSERMGEDQIFLAEIGIVNSKIRYSERKFYTYFRNFPNQLTGTTLIIDSIRESIFKLNKVSYHFGADSEEFVKLMMIRMRLTYLKNRWRHSKLTALSISDLSLGAFLHGSWKKTIQAILLFIGISFKNNARRPAKNFVALTGGLGNQLFQLAGAMATSEGSVEILGCVGKPRSMSGYPDLLDFELPRRISIHECNRESRILNRFYNLHLSLGLSDRAFFSLKPIKICLTYAANLLFSFHLREPVKIIVSKGVGYDPNLRPKTGNLLFGYLQSYKWSCASETSEELQKITLRRGNSELEGFEKEASSRSILVLHVRLGDYKSEPNFGTLSERYFDAALNEAFKRKSFQTIWLFSDEPVAALSFIPTEFHNKIRVIKDDGKSPAFSLQLMRLGSGYIIANSTFSWWGARLSSSPGALVIAPKTWFTGAPEPQELIPPDWIRL